MRKFAATCCCAIVGLQVLIGVPLVTCLLLFALAADNPFVGDAASYAPPYPVGAATVPPPEYSPVSLSPQPLPPCAPGLSPQMEDILAARQQRGSPLDGTLLADLAPLPKTTTEAFVAQIEQVAVQDLTLPELPPAASLKPQETTCLGNLPVQPTLRESLSGAVHQLYALADRLEADSDFDRADRVRRLTRELRHEIERLPGEVGSPPPQPSTVTEAAHNPELPVLEATTIAPPVEPQLALPPLADPDPAADQPLNPAKPAF